MAYLCNNSLIFQKQFEDQIITHSNIALLLSNRTKQNHLYFIIMKFCSVRLSVRVTD